jgi:ABC-type molybdate transport system substrate-binding protein
VINTSGRESVVKTGILAVLVVTALLTTGYAQQLSGTYELNQEYGSIGSMHYTLVFKPGYKGTLVRESHIRKDVGGPIESSKASFEITYEVDGNDFKYSTAGKTVGTITKSANLPPEKYTVPAGQECLFVDRAGFMCKSSK